MIQEVPVGSSAPASSTHESTQAPASSLELADAPEPAEQEPAEQEPQESQEPEEPAEPGSSASVPEAHPPPVPKTRVPPRVKPKAKPKAESTQQVLAECEQSSRASGTSAPKAKPKAKRAPKKTEAPPEETDRFASFSNTQLMSEMLKRTESGERRNSNLHCALIAEIIARSNDHRMEEKRAMYRSFLQ